MKVSVLTIGDELLIGQVVNTNASTISKMVSEIGAEVVLQISAADTEASIFENLKRCLNDSDWVLVSGGLGPTHDDLTVEVVSKYFNRELEYSKEALDRARAFYTARNREMPSNNEKLAYNPKGAVLLLNDCGTASGVLIEESGKTIVLMPGVPYELQSMMKREVLPKMAPKVTGEKIHQKTLTCVGLGESVLAERIGDLSKFLNENTKLAFLPSPQSVRLRMTLKGSIQSEVEERMKRFETHIRNQVGKYIVSSDSESLEEILCKLFLEKKKTIAVAESCTGGRVLDRLTNISGSSAYVRGGVVAYSNEVKVSELGVLEETLKKLGAVSAETAAQMAEGVRKRLKADIGLSLTGIAGPTGGSAEKPVGLVFIGFSDGVKTITLKNVFDNDRLRNKDRASQTALDLVRKYLLGILDEYEPLKH